MKNIREKLFAGEAVHGCWLNSGAAINAEIVGKAGFDWVTIDLEHGVGTENNLLYQLQALKGSDAVPFVRVEALVRQRAGRLLDIGAGGIIFPQIKNADEARQAVSFTRYPPEGTRGMAVMVRATEFGKDFDNYYATKKNDALNILQIETRESLHYLEEIAQIEGVDVLFVGPADLTLSLGIFRQFDHPDYLEAIKRVNKVAEKAGKATGILMGNPGEYEKYYTLGFRMLGCGSDSVFVSQGAGQMVSTMSTMKATLK